MGYIEQQLTIQPPIQLNSLTGTYATSTYLAALKKGPKDLESLAKDVEAFDKKIKEDDKVASFIRESWSAPRIGRSGAGQQCRQSYFRCLSDLVAASANTLTDG
jgi:hypothetical protein